MIADLNLISFWRLPGVASVLVLCLSSVTGAPDTQPPSRAASLAFLTPDREFTGVEPPGWVLDGAVKVFVGLEDLGAIDDAAAAGATIVHAGGPWPYYPLVKDDPSSGVPAEEKARLLKGVARAKAHGMRVLLGVAPYAPPPIVREHPEWMVFPQDDPAYAQKAALDLTRPEHVHLRALALHSPYGDYLIECLAEMMRALGIDGFSFDGNYHAPLNFSPFERALYHKETGRALPKAIDLGSVDYRLYLLWADEKLEQWYRRLRARLKQVNPEAAIYTWTTNAGRYGHFLTTPRVMSARMNRLFDCPVQEWWLDEVNLGSSVVPLFGAAYVRAVSGGRVGASEPYIMSRGNPYSSESFPRHELLTRCLGAMVNGSFTPLSLAAGRENTLAVMREIKRRSPWFVRNDPAPWAALLVSEQTRQFYAGGQIMERFLAHALGVFRVAFEEHLPLTLITEQDVRPETLARFRLLVLPNAACLSDEQAAVIREFVRRGGGLVATCETSLFNELGQARPDFALRDLFGVSYQGRPQAPVVRPPLDANFAIVVDEKYWAHRVGVAALRWGASDILDSTLVDDPRLHALVPQRQATFKGPLVKMSEPALPMKRAMILFPEGSRDAIPIVAMGTNGAGRVVYLAAGFDAANFSYGYPYQRVLLAGAMRLAAAAPFPIEVKAPLCVQATFWERRTATGRQMIVHLFNGLNTAAGHGLPEVEVPLREESVPVGGIELRVTGIELVRVRVEPEAQDLTARREGEGWVIDVPPVAIHSAVVMEVRSPE